MNKFMLSSAAATASSRYLLHITRDDRPKCGHRIASPVFVDKIIRDEPRLGLCQRCGSEEDFADIEAGRLVSVKSRPTTVQQTWNNLVSLSALMKAYNAARRQHFCANEMLRHAFGIAMNKSTQRFQDHWRTVGHEQPFQHFSQSACSCKGSIHNKMCKHKTAARLLDTAIEIEGEYLALQCLQA